MRGSVIAIGRFNPPTAGHELLINTLISEANNNNLPAFLFIVDGIGSSKNLDKNPLTAYERKEFINKLFPKLKIEIVSTGYEVIDVLEVQGYYPKIWIAGSDRSESYKKMIVSAGIDGIIFELDRNSSIAKGVTATDARKEARSNNFENFKNLMPSCTDKETLTKLMKRICEENDNRYDSSNSTKCRTSISLSDSS